MQITLMGAIALALFLSATAAVFMFAAGCSVKETALTCVSTTIMVIALCLLLY